MSSKASNGSQLSTVTIGTSQRGLPIQALIATSGQSTQATAINSNDKPTVLLVGGQRGDEPASTEALLVVARELGQGGLLAPLLQQINIIILPRASLMRLARPATLRQTAQTLFTIICCSALRRHRPSLA